MRAYFLGNVQKKQLNQKNLKSNTITVTMTIKPDSKHLGEIGDIISVAYYLPDRENNSVGYMQMPNKEWHRWDGEIQNIVDVYNDEILEDNMEVNIFEGKLNIPPGKVEIYVGYRLSGNIVFNGMEPITFNVP